MKCRRPSKSEMTSEEKRLVIAEALSESFTNKGWIFAPDNLIPAEAYMYAIYDGIQVVGGGYASYFTQDKVRRCKMPIVFWAAEAK